MSRIKIDELSQQQDRSKYDFEIQFIFGTSSARIIDIRPNLRLDMPLDEEITEDNLTETFADLCEALQQSGKLKADGKVLCTTFPAGTMSVDIPDVVN